MLRMQTWQWMVVVVVALACVGAMSWTVTRMFGRRAERPASLREATAFESARVGSTPPPGAAAYDGYAYRVPARFAGRLRVVVSDGAVTVAGPRMADGLYAVWIWIQALLLALVPAAIVAALVRLDWRWAVAGLVLALASWTVQITYAGMSPGIGELRFLEAGRFDAVRFPVSDVSDVDIGSGWSRGGIDVVLAPYRAGIDAMAKGRAVSFFAPDERGRQVRYAIHCLSDEDARGLAAALQGRP